MRHLLEDPANTPIAIEQLRMGGDALLLEIYRLYQGEFVNWAKSKCSLDEENCKDVFREAVITLFKKAKAGLEKEIYSSIKAYLFGIARNLLKKKIEKEKKYSYQEELDEDLIKDWDNAIYQKTDNEHLKYILAEGLLKIGDPCKTILILKFYDNFAGESIAKRVGYKNAAVVHEKTKQCLKRLKSIMKDKV